MATRGKKRSSRTARRKTNKRKFLQRGGGLKEDALKVLKDNDITNLEKFVFESGKFVLNKEGTAYNDVIYGAYTFRKTRDMSRQYHLIVFETSKPDGDKVTLYTANDY
jgi:hypothetical protein